MSAKSYKAKGIDFEFSPNGSPLEGVLLGTFNGQTFSSHLNLSKLGSRASWARAAAELYPDVFDESQLKRALNEVCTLRLEEVEAAADKGEQAQHKDEVPPEEDDTAEELINTPGVLGRFVEDAAFVRGVVGDRYPLKAIALGAFSSQLAPLPNGKPLGTNVVLTAPPGRGKNHDCDAVAALMPDEVVLKFESASAKALFYRAENDPKLLQHRWLYPDEAEGIDNSTETLRPLLSSGRAAHLTVNKDDGRNVAQELSIEGPVTLTIPTVRNKLDAQLQSRMLVVELQDYKGRVANHSRKVSEMVRRDFADADHAEKIRNWQVALRKLTSIRRVVFDLPDDRFCLDSDEAPQGARLWANFLSLMLTHAWLEQRNRNVIELGNGEEAIVATPKDYEAVYEIFENACERSVINLSETHRKILNALHDLEEDSTFSDGFSQRKIAEKAGVHHSTVGDQKTFLMTSAKLIREVEDGGLALVSGADPSWWQKGEIMAGFPRPEQVWEWWGDGPDGFETTRQRRQGEEATHKADNYGQSTGGHPTRHPSATADEDHVGGSGGQLADTLPATGHGLDKPNEHGERPMAGVAGCFATEDHPPKVDDLLGDDGVHHHLADCSCGWCTDEEGGP